MIKKTLKISGIIFLLFIIIGVFIIFQMLSNYKKLESAKLAENFVTDTIPFTYSNSGHILLKVKMEGSGKTYPFILDSGASNMIFSHHSEEFDLESSGRGFGIGSNGSFFFTKIKKIEHIQIGDLKLKNVYAEEVDFDFDCMGYIYGIIGNGVMHHFDWQIDFEKKRIIVSQNMNIFSFDKNRIIIPLSENQFSHHLKTSFQLGNSKNSVTAIIDLGSSGNLSLDRSALKKKTANLISKRVFGNGSKGLGDQKNSVSRAKFYLLDSLIFPQSGYHIENFPIFTSPKGSNLIGLGFFKHFKTTISWSENKLILEPYDSLQDFTGKISGFKTRFDEKTGNVYISAIIEGSMAYRKKVPLHSEVLSINDIVFSDKTSYCKSSWFTTLNDTIRLKLKYKGLIKEYVILEEPIF